MTESWKEERLTTSHCRLRSLPNPNIVAFAMAFKCCDEAAYTGADDEDADARRRIAMDSVLLFRQMLIDVGGIQLLDKVRHGCQMSVVR
jgi:hypothetical protein